MVSRTPRRTLRCLRPGSHSRFGPHLNLIAEKIAPFFSSTYVEPILQPFCFHIHACNGGVYPPPQRSDVQICKSKLNCSCGAEIPIRSGRFDVFPVYLLSLQIIAHIAYPPVVRPFQLGWRKGESERAKKSLSGLQGSDGMQLVPAVVGVVDVGTGDCITLADLRLKIRAVISAAGF